MVDASGELPDGDALAADALDSAPDVVDVAPVDGGPACGNGICDELETLANCAADCAFLADRYGGACTKPGTRSECADGFVCIPLGQTVDTALCVADLDTWPPIPDKRLPDDFVAGAGTVTDAHTGLTWAQLPTSPVSAVDALAACLARADGGFHDWRLPTLAELVSLVDRSHVSRAVTAPAFTWSTDDLYWTASAEPSLASVWTQDFSVGESYMEIVQMVDGTAMLHPVRCVRKPGNQPAGLGERFVKEGSGLTVLDRATGLHWQWYYSSTKMPLADAVSWCSHNTPGLPGEGWRLPTAGELFRLTDRGGHNPSIAQPFATVNELFWTSTPYVDHAYQWLVSFDFGGYVRESTVYLARVRCVR